MKYNQGFTLIELMIVIAIIGILASIAIPAYQQYTKKSRIQACLYEVKGYSNMVYVGVYDQDNTSNPPAPTAINSCSSVTDASGWVNGDDVEKINAQVKGFEAVTIECDLELGVKCIIHDE